MLAGLATTAAEALFERLLPAEHVGLRSHAPTFARAAAVLFLRQAEGAAGNRVDEDMLLVAAGRQGIQHGGESDARGAARPARAVDAADSADRSLLMPSDLPVERLHCSRALPVA